jgi:hypothetical protein
VREATTRDAGGLVASRTCGAGLDLDALDFLSRYFLLDRF